MKPMNRKPNEKSAKSNQKLQLKRETIRSLSNADLTKINGGLMRTPGIRYTTA